jgi:hypothetical protein
MKEKSFRAAYSLDSFGRDLFLRPGSVAYVGEHEMNGSRSFAALAF